MQLVFTLLLSVAFSCVKGQTTEAPSYSCNENDLTVTFTASRSSHSALQPTSNCSLQRCIVSSNTSNSCLSSSTPCFDYRTLSNISYCGPGILCSVLEPCNNITYTCASNTSVCIVNSCCSPQAMCLPLSLTNFCIREVVNSLQVKVPRYLGIYYGYLSEVNNVSINSSTVVADTVAIFSQFDVLVFSDGLPSDSPYLNNTKMVVQQLVRQGKEVYGYVDLGVSTTNRSVAEFESDVDTWLNIGVTGIFWDDVGYDYGTTRDRQITAFNYTRNKNLTIIANAWDPDDVFNGSDVLLDSRDIYLLESYLTYDNGTYQNFSDWSIKADKCVQYAAQYGVRMATLSYSIVTANFASTSSQFNYTFFGTAMYNFDFFQVSDFLLSSGDNIIYFYSKPSSSYGSIWQTGNVIHANATYFYRQTDTHTLILTGDEITYGIGAMIPSS